MNFLVNTSPFAGKEGKFVTTRNIKDRLQRELERNLALRVEPGETADAFVVSGRGALHISILIENMRREGFEFGVGPPRVRCAAADCPQAAPHTLRRQALLVAGASSAWRCSRARSVLGIPEALDCWLARQNTSCACAGHHQGRPQG